MPQITDEMSLEEMFLALAEGNPGALNVVLELYTAGPVVDPDNALGGPGVIGGDR